MDAERLNANTFRYDLNSLDTDCNELKTLLEIADADHSDITDRLKNINYQYSPIVEYGVVVALTSAAARTVDKDTIKFFTDDGGNTDVQRKVWCSYAVPPHTKTLKVVGCFDGFDILKAPDGKSKLYLRCNQGGLIHWSRV